jgi:uncharacterized damage-inducible protein DinB/predicted RNase H-like HicB family nuclease
LSTSYIIARRSIFGKGDGLVFQAGGVTMNRIQEVLGGIVARYAVYLEIAPSSLPSSPRGEGREEGECLAHAYTCSAGTGVPDLPGCTVRASSRAEALARLPGAIDNHLAWLRRHGETVPPEGDPVEVEVAGESHGFGPFNPGDAAALFPPDHMPVSLEEMEVYFRLMAHARADLLALVERLPKELLDRQPGADLFTIRRILRHVGNAEEWYVSRLVPPETLPAEWEHDDELPIFEFLAMERRTAVDRLRRITAEERAAVVYPAHWTEHPDEPWTARKALRRAVEHEREHTGQIQEILRRNQP